MKALAFDVFGTLVDWRSGIARAATPVLADPGRTDIDPYHFADGWRARYQPALEQVRNGARDFVILDTLHREALDDLLREHDIASAAVGEARLVALTHAWHRLDPWHDVVAGLAELRRDRPVVALSNGHVPLIVTLSRHAGLVWDAVLGAGVSRVYKPLPDAYRATADYLAIAPHDLCLVAAHHSDLAAARAVGLQTAFIHRPMEYGGRPAPDAAAAQDWEYAADSLAGLSVQIACGTA